jgi:hypothetical protein
MDARRLRGPAKRAASSSEDFSMRKTKHAFGHRELWATALLLASSGCTGVASMPPGGGSAGGGGNNSGGAGNTNSPGGGSNVGNAGGNGGPTTAGGGMATTTTTTTTPGAAGSLGTVPPGPLDSGRVALRRLNVREYDNTMRDLLGTAQTVAVNTFPGESPGDGFDTVGLTFSDLLVKDEFAAAGTLVGELVARTATDPLKTAVYVCTPTTANMSTCLSQILTDFMPKAWRRPVTAAEVTAATAVGTAAMTAATGATATAGATATDPATAAVSAALEYVLMSPNFLYHVELGSPAITPSSTAATPLSDYEVASRMSYFLWSSMPDAALTQAAAAATLANQKGIPAQLTRMVADPKFSGFMTGFTDQWLAVNTIDSAVMPSATVFPTEDAALIASMGPETDAFVGNLITTNAPLTDLLTANYTFANGRLAQFYGITGVPATQTTFTKVSLAGTPRLGGILTQETFLATTSKPDRTSPVDRGQYVLANMVCTPPQPAPPNVPLFMPAAPGSMETARQVLDEHANNPGCSTCHNSMDPIGYTFENFDGSGAYRTTDNGVAVDASGSLYGKNGAPVDGAQAMAAAIAADPRFVQCIVKEALTFGIGRSFEQPDGIGYVETVAQPLAKGGTWQSALQTVVTSQAFLTTRGGT